MKKLLYVEDDKAYLKRIARHIREKYPQIEPITCQDSLDALPYINQSLDLLILYLEMPLIDGKKLLNYAINRGLDRKKIIIISSRDANYLHEIIPMGECLCVLNKNEIRQMEVLEMILASIDQKVA